MSLSSASTLSRRAVRVGVAAVVLVALLAPATYLFTRVWDDNTATLDFNRAERRGVAYLGPLTDLLAVVTRTQSAAVRGEGADAAAIRRAIAAVDEVDARLGDRLRTTERWTAIRQTVMDRSSRSYPDPATAYQQYSDLVTTLTELTRKVGDLSNLILDPRLDAYYVMNATLLRIPAILVDSGRYLDLSVISRGRTGQDTEEVALLTTARNRIGDDSTDLYDGLIKAFGATGSTTLGPGLTGPLDDFRAAVAAVAPSTSLLAPPPDRTVAALAGDQAKLQKAALALQKAGLTELDRLLASREDSAARTRVLAVACLAALGVVVVVAALGFVLLLPDSTPADPWDEEEDAPAARAAGAAGGDLVGAGLPGGARAPR